MSLSLAAKLPVLSACPFNEQKSIVHCARSLQNECEFYYLSKVFFFSVSRVASRVPQSPPSSSHFNVKLLSVGFPLKLCQSLLSHPAYFFLSLSPPIFPSNVSIWSYCCVHESFKWNFRWFWLAWCIDIANKYCYVECFEFDKQIFESV